MNLNMQGIMEQVERMQKEMEKTRQELDQKIITAESGGGMVAVTMTGTNDVIKIKLAKEIVNPDDIEMLEDLIVAAVNKATKAVQDMVGGEMGKFSKMLPNIPGLNLGV